MPTAARPNCRLRVERGRLPPLVLTTFLRTDAGEGVATAGGTGPNRLLGTQRMRMVPDSEA